jgi:peptidoglycan/xylan/chitin deacetylase (PgdA/CDA1 family)
MLRAGKLFALRLARISGLTSLWMNTPWRRNRLLILAYHGTSLCDEHEWDPSLYMPPTLLARRLELIRKSGCTVLSLEEAIRRLYEGDLPPRSVTITVDDGTYDFYREGFPVFESFRFPVTVYLTTYYAGFNRPVYDGMSSYLLWKGRGRTLRWPEVFGTSDAIALSDSGCQFARQRLRRYPVEQQLSGAGKDELLQRLAELLDIDYSGILARRILHIMNLAEAQELAARGVDFELHTHRHGVSLDRGTFEREIADNREWLQRVRPGDARHFCYPGGVYRQEFVPWLRECKIMSATTCEAGFASRGAEPLLLPRLVDSSPLTELEFAGWLSGIASFLPKRRYVEAEGQFLEDRAKG